MPDLYLYEDVPVLRNKLGIRDEKALDLIEAEQSRQNMMILYEAGFHDFSPTGLREIHKALFADIYEWAGEYRVINIEKREKLLAGRSVWYSNAEEISADLERVFSSIHSLVWPDLSREQFVQALARCFAGIWRVHPFREGNTRTVVMMLTFFVEHHGYYMDQEMMAVCSGYVRDSFVMASLDQNAEYVHLEKILMDAVCEEPITYDEASLEIQEPVERTEKYKKYRKEKYEPQPHHKRSS